MRLASVIVSSLTIVVGFLPMEVAATARTATGKVDALTVVREEASSRRVDVDDRSVATTGSWSTRFLLPDIPLADDSDAVLDVVSTNGRTVYATRNGLYEILADRTHPRLFSQQMRAIYPYGDGVAISGWNPAIGHVSYWDGEFRQPLGDGLEGDFGDDFTVVETFTLHQGFLYAGGAIEASGSQPLGPVARWDGTAWRPVGEGLHGRVRALLSFGGTLFAGGDVTVTDAVGAVVGEGVASFTGVRWEPVGTDQWGTVRALETDGTTVWAGGQLRVLERQPAYALARWDGSLWWSTQTFDDEILTIHSRPDGLWIGGKFRNFPSYARRDPMGAWSVPGGGVVPGGRVETIVEWNGGAGLGGHFEAFGSEAELEGFALRRNDTWEGLGLGVGGEVHRVRRIGSHVVVAGDFEFAGGLRVNRIARHQVDHWVGYGDGFNARVHDFVEYQGALIAAGRFTRSGSTDLSYVARWDGSSWVPLGEGTDDYVYTLAVWDGLLWAGGSFTTAGGVPASGLAVWDGSSWAAGLGGVSGGEPAGPAVYALEAGQIQLWIGGAFDAIGGTPAANVARSQSGAVVPAGNGLPGGWVLSFGVYAPYMSAGGTFPGSLMTWQGSTWINRAAPIPVWAIESVPGGVAIAGPAETWIYFQTGSGWSAASIDTGALANDIWWQGDSLWVGGTFTRAGGVTSHHVGVFTPTLTESTPEADAPLPVSSPFRVSNPFEDLLRVDMETSADRIEIFDVSGRRRLQRDLPRSSSRVQTFDLSGYAAGVYFVRVTSAGSTVTRKAVKAR
ncbi:MAG: T9SS type A sorting domain-containing protein [bacterium]